MQPVENILIQQWNPGIEGYPFSPSFTDACKVFDEMPNYVKILATLFAPSPLADIGIERWIHSFMVEHHLKLNGLLDASPIEIYLSTLLTSVMLLEYCWFFTSVMLQSLVLRIGRRVLFQKLSFEPGEMWWTSSLIQLSLFKVTHEQGQKLNEGTSHTRVFLLVLTTGFTPIYDHIVLDYWFSLLTSFSWQYGFDLNGLDIAARGFDCSRHFISLVSVKASKQMISKMSLMYIELGGVFVDLLNEKGKVFSEHGMGYVQRLLGFLTHPLNNHDLKMVTEIVEGSLRWTHYLDHLPSWQGSVPFVCHSI